MLTRRLFPVLLFALVTAVACGHDSPPASSLGREEKSAKGHGQPDAEVVAAVDQALAAGQLDGVKWANLRDVVADLRTVYGEQDDRLVWFDGTKPESKLEPALAAIAGAGIYGLDPADYDASLLADKWSAIQSGSASGRDRAAFDLTVSLAAARMIRAVHAGRVDPATMQWNYAAAAKTESFNSEQTATAGPLPFAPSPMAPG